ncbi:MAG: leucine--tRNA ligase [bacterium]|nr:leucine--tRNA ligase [bacterium]
MRPYLPKEIEAKWRKRWESAKSFEVDIEKAPEPFYNLMMFPYPSGEGLHVGHVYAFGGADTFGHYMKMKGKDVFEPMGFDSFGIHSENFAIKQGKHPKELIEQTTKYFREEQLKKLGALFDWQHSVTTSDPDYYRWTQWLFIQLFKAGLAVRKKAKVDWCPSCKTVLADEQVIGGKCERCGTEVESKELEQWFFKITDYAQRLLDNLEKIDWSETTKTMQKNWIGRSDGAEIKFKLRNVPGQEDGKHSVSVYTTRPETIFGATFLVISPETVKSWLEVGWKASDEVKSYVEESLNKTEITRQEEGKDKTGIDSEIKAVHPLTGELLPVWVADYVLGSYGSGAIMAVPAHDRRDYAFAKKFKLPIVEVIDGQVSDKEVWEGEGKLINSRQFNGQSTQEAKNNISKYLEENQYGSVKVNYHLRDWLISRQRYWGPPIPMIYCSKCAEEGKSWFTSEEAKNWQNEKLKIKSGKILHSSFSILNSQMVGWYPVSEKDLPVELPEIEDYQPKGSGVSPLSSLPEFVSVKCPSCGEDAKRETDVSDTFLDSSWYFLRYPSTKVKNEPFDRSLTKKWLPVDMYIGGNEHAVLHLLYTRFITMVLRDQGWLNFEEPFKKFRAHSLITYKGAKMSKSRGNVINPNEYMDTYGTDTLRMYLLFIGPYDQGGEFNDRAIAGMFRFLARVWTLTQEVKEKPGHQIDPEQNKKLQELIKNLDRGISSLKFNTSIAYLMEFVNLLYKNKEKVHLELLKQFVLVLAPFAPFIAEEIWGELGGDFSVHQQSWPEFDSSALAKKYVTVVVQVNGKMRDKIEVSSEAAEEEVTRLVVDRPKIKNYTQGKRIKKTIFVKGRLVNLVV